MALAPMAFNPANGLKDPAYSPTNPGSEAAIRQQIQGIADQLRDFINNTLLPQMATHTDLASVVLGQLPQYIIDQFNQITDTTTGKTYHLTIINGQLYAKED